MKKNFLPSLILILLLLMSLTGCIGGGSNGKTNIGTIQDSTGDSLGTPDLTSASVSLQGGNVKLSVQFNPGTFSMNTTYVSFILDTDQNPATGHPGVNAGGVDDSGIISTDYLVTMGSNFHGTQARVKKYAGSVNTFTQIGNVTVTYGPNGMEASIPLSMLGSDDGILNFKANCSTQISASGFTGILDYITDVGLPVGTSN